MTVAELPAGSRPARVYAEGWQSWSPVRLLSAGETTPTAPDEFFQLTALRPGRPVPEGVIQAEGVLVVAPEDGPATAWFAPDPAAGVATIRLAARGDRLVIEADGPVDSLEAHGLDEALAAVGERLAVPQPAPIPAGWSSWSCYFDRVTELDVAENIDAAGRLSLPVGIVQIDNGYEAAVGDWLSPKPAFGSVRDVAARITAAGMRAGIWTAPFLVSASSDLARTHPEWIVPDAYAGRHWGLRMGILDVTHPAAAEHMSNVFRTLRGWGYTFHKVDFMYAGAIDGRRHSGATGLEAYRAGLGLIRDAIGPDATLLACGAPLLPSIGLCDAMRVGPDVLAEVPDPQLDLPTLMGVNSLRAWMNGRLWVNDPDTLVARPGLAGRERWAGYLEGYGGLAFSSDRLAELDGIGLELTRRVLSGR